MVSHNWDEVRRFMWDYVGIVRTNRRLQRALRRITTLRREIRAYYRDYLVTTDLLELRNIAAVAELVIRSRDAAAARAAACITPWTILSRTPLNASRRC